MSRNKKTKKGSMAMPVKRKLKIQPRQESVAIVQKSGPRMPKTITKGNGTVVSHTETYGVNITGSDPFALSATWAIQPGLKTYSRGSPLGVWLPEIAQNFDNYEIESLKFKFRSACSTLTTGLAVFGYEPNPEGVAPATYQELRNMHSVDGSVHANLVFDVTSKVRRRLLIRKGNVVNLPSYDAGRVYFGTIGVGNNALVGFVDVEYRVRLMNPQASITSTAPVLANPLLPLPAQWLSWDASGMVELNVATNSLEPWQWFCDGIAAGGGTNQGAQLMAPTSRYYDALSATYASGCKYVIPVGSGKSSLRVVNSGNYRVSFTPRWDWYDLKMYALAPFRSPNSPGAVTPCYTQVFTQLDGVAGTIDVDHKTHRGFTGTATLDPNPGTDVWPTFTWEVMLYADDDFQVLVGQLLYNDASTDAKVRGRTNLGRTTLKIEYLGSIQTNA